LRETRLGTVTSKLALVLSFQSANIRHGSPRKRNCPGNSGALCGGMSGDSKSWSRGASCEFDGATPLGNAIKPSTSSSIIRFAGQRDGKRSRWLNDTDSFARFFKQFCRNVDLSQFPVVASVDLGEIPIAAALCLNNTISVEYAFTTYDESFSKYRPGKLLLKYLIEWSLTKGRDFSFGIMIAPYKEEWPVERRAYVSRAIFTSRLGRAPTPDEVWRATRARLAASPLLRRVCGRRPLGGA
jgi:hypothetical protein